MANEISTIRANDNFALAAASAQTSQIVGERLRFSKGQYLIGKGDFSVLADGTELQAIDIMAAWIKFSPEGKVVDQRVGYPMPAREELDDTDESDWPLKYGVPADPWSNQRYLYLIDPNNGAEYTFVTSSWGGRAAVEGLARQVYVKRSGVPGAVATVRLTVGYKSSPRYGQVPAPKFEVVGWSGGTEEPPRSIAAELDDELPPDWR